MDLKTIFPTEDFRLKMRFERGSPATFYKPGSNSEAILAERKRWLSMDAETCTAITKEGELLLEELFKLAVSWDSIPNGSGIESTAHLSPIERCRWLCGHWETDFLLLQKGPDGKFRLQGGALCFPSHWDLRSKLGRTVSEIHDPVPGLNAELGRSIDGFLEKIPAGISWERHNWGLSRSPELNQHPSRDLPPLDETVSIEDVWWRLEDQSLVALPTTGGVLFGIRVTVHPLADVRAHPTARIGLSQALETMSEEMATYKGIARARSRICELLNS